MITQYSKARTSIRNLFNRILPLSLISDEKEIATNLNNSLVANPNNENNDDEWLEEKHRILDGRIEYRNLMKTINNINNH
jgi:hypothetical protein